MITFRRPMLAAPLLPPEVEHTDERILEALHKLRYPVLASLKMDGVRALRLNGSLLSRTLKPIPNRSIRERSLIMPGGFDMELWNPELQFNEIESIVMSREHPSSDKIQFHVLDQVPAIPSIGYSARWETISAHTIWRVDYKDVKVGTIVLCIRAEHLFSYFSWVEQEKGEGVCFRLPDSPYKQGRSTLREQYLVKLARYVEEEAVITGFIEQVSNCNPDHYNRVGLMDRSSSQSNLVGKNTLGAFTVQAKDGLTFNIGTGVGLTDKLRQEIWHNQDKYLGRTITFKCKAHGRKVKPRSPVFKGFRQDT